MNKETKPPAEEGMDVVSPIVGYVDEKNIEVFTMEQRQRVKALKAGREILGNRGFASSTGPDVVDVIDLAKYVIEGVHPHDRFPDPSPEVVDE